MHAGEDADHKGPADRPVGEGGPGGGGARGEGAERKQGKAVLSGADADRGRIRRSSC
jgi:hypothetical protein